MPPRLGFMTAEFYWQTSARNKKHFVRAPGFVKIIKKRQEHKGKLDTRKSSNSIRPMTLQNAEIQVWAIQKDKNEKQQIPKTTRFS